MTDICLICVSDMHLTSGAEIAVAATALCSCFDCHFLLAADFKRILNPSPGLQTLAVCVDMVSSDTLRARKGKNVAPLFLLHSCTSDNLYYNSKYNSICFPVSLWPTHTGLILLRFKIVSRLCKCRWQVRAATPRAQAMRSCFFFSSPVRSVTAIAGDAAGVVRVPLGQQARCGLVVAANFRIGGTER